MRRGMFAVILNTKKISWIIFIVEVKPAVSLIRERITLAIEEIKSAIEKMWWKKIWKMENMNWFIRWMVKYGSNLNETI